MFSSETKHFSASFVSMTFEEKFNSETTQKSDCNYLEREPSNQETKK